MSIYAVVLGAAAGGGFPQWNSNAPACRRARNGDPAAPARTQASVAVSSDRENWFLLNASPDLRQQIAATPQLHPRIGLRSSPIAGVVLTGGDVDAIAGLLTLRERQPLTIYATGAAHAVLDSNTIFEVLARDVVARRIVPLDEPCTLTTPDGAPSGLSFTLFAAPGKVPLYLERQGETPGIFESENTVGLALTDGRKRLFFIPGCAAMTAGLARRLDGADAVFFDGTLWRDDEMIQAGVGVKTGRRMGHMSVSGPDGVMAAFATLKIESKILIHINNSNPILLDDAPERALTEQAGWRVAYDGMEVTL
jgi:pyrroloquinoline quinone biosynthesis protein B